MTLFRTAFYGLLALLLTIALPSLGARPLADAPLDGFWKGPLQLPGGKLEVIFRLVKLSSGDYFATLDVPLQKVSHLPVTVTAHADTVTFASAEANCRFIGRLQADGSHLEGTWEQPGFKTPLTLTRTAPAVAPAGTKPRLTPPYREEEVTVTNAAASLTLAGMLTVPAGPGPFPAVALLSDAGAQERNGTMSDFAVLGRLADYLTRRGIAVLRFDDRGTGLSTGDAQATMGDLVSDAQAALSFLRTRPELDQQHIGLIGHGEGGNVALLAAAQPSPPAFVVGLAPYGLPGSDIALQQQEATLKSLQLGPSQLAAALKRQQSIIDVIRQTATKSQARAIVINIMKQNNPLLDEATAQASATEMTSAAYRYFLSFNPAEKLAAVTCPVLLVYGTADTKLNPDANMEALVKGLKNSKALATRKMPGVNHLFQPERDQWPIIGGESQPNFSPPTQDAVRAWIVTLLGPPAAPAPAPAK